MVTLMLSRSLSVALLLGAIGASSISAAAQDRRLPPISAAAFADLKARPAADPAVAGSQDWVIRWNTRAANASQQDTFSVIDRRDLVVAAVRERDPQLAPDRLLVIAVDDAGTTLDWRIVADPTVLRAETPDATGLLSGQILTQPSADFRVALAADPRISELRIYKPRWTGTEFVLEPLGTSAGAR
jgi:hypothetical protein